MLHNDGERRRGRIAHDERLYTDEEGKAWDGSFWIAAVVVAVEFVLTQEMACSRRVMVHERMAAGSASARQILKAKTRKERHEIKEMAKMKLARVQEGRNEHSSPGGGSVMWDPPDQQPTNKKSRSRVWVCSVKLGCGAGRRLSGSSPPRPSRLV